ncbi:MAG: ABC transporter permease [Dehalococcoidia bacterium]|nr:ABC transporter permease [Dehalococcoidia bacterium]MXY88418.1 ABC transporter permease [Dehalococcoidia bacterium]MXZ87708.1 ABC transporter permease [Dehalococcoidia bacterium]MYA53059.1 ABC transporter permease [Dehalococcoidia bacterium]MYH68274.1 ABC transporter permease [Dehalococcoidia bacterium]
MSGYIVRRLLLVPITLFIITIIVFIFMRAIPGDAGLVKCGAAGSFDETCFEQVRKELGLDKSYFEQYTLWLGDIVLRGDFGFSPIKREHINSEIGPRIWNTAQVGLISIVFTLIMGVPVGAISAIRSGRPIDYVLRFFAVLGLSIPNFWIATLVIIFPVVWWGTRWVPDWVGWEEPWDHLRVIAIPAFIFALASGATVARIVRSSMLEVLRSDYVRTSRAKGLREFAVVSRHVFRPSMIALFTIAGLQLSVVLGGSVILEAIFGIPGMGSWVIRSVGERDFIVIQGVVVFFATWFLVITLLVDIGYAWIDPRIRY